MGAPTEYYVDPSLGSDTGDGTIGTPWGRASGSVIQYAVDTITRDTTNGDRINVKAGAYDTLTASMNFTGIYGSGTAAAPLYIQGYTSTAGDGGIGQVDGTASGYNMSNTAMDYCYFKDLELKDCPIKTDNNCVAYNIYCYSSASSSVGLQFDNNAVIVGCRVETVGNSLDVVSNGHVSDCYFACSGAGADAVAINNSCHFERNIVVSTSSNGTGISVNGAAPYVFVLHNSVISTASSTGDGISITATGTDCSIYNNLVEGFSGTGGVGINWQSASDGFPIIYANNAVYDCATEYSTLSGELVQYEADNETLTASPFAKSGSVTYANRATYFAPSSTGSVQTGAYGGFSTLSKGAIQATGGTGATNVAAAKFTRLE